MPRRVLNEISGACSLLFVAVVLSANPAVAQDSGSNPIAAALGALGFTPPKHAPMPDFVSRTQPRDSDLHFIPLGSARPQPSSRALTRSEIEAEEAKLTALRDRDNLRAGRKAPVVRAASAAGKEIVPRKKPRPTCRITCKIDLMKIGQDDSVR